MTPKLGRLVNHDPRSRAFPARVSQLTSVTHYHWGGSLDQGDLGSCTGNALATARNTSPIRKSRRLLNESDAVSVYARATHIDPFDGYYPPDDTGSSGLAACKAAMEYQFISGYTHAFGFDHVLAALVLSPVMIGVNWYEDMFTLGPKGFAWPTGALVGGHEFTLVKLNMEYRYVECVNSWGNYWGPLNGRFRLAFSVLDRLLSEDGDAIVPIG